MNETLDRLESIGCSCDLLYGYSCSFHGEVQKLRERIKENNILLNQLLSLLDLGYISFHHLGPHREPEARRNLESVIDKIKLGIGFLDENRKDRV